MLSLRGELAPLAEERDRDLPRSGSASEADKDDPRVLERPRLSLLLPEIERDSTPDDDVVEPVVKDSEVGETHRVRPRLGDISGGESKSELMIGDSGGDLNRSG